jgi:hypothetical protein
MCFRDSDRHSEGVCSLAADAFGLLTKYLDGISAFLPQIIGSPGSEEFDHLTGLKKGDAAASQDDIPLHSEVELS